MNEKVLVAYASTHGAMQEVAEVVAETLRECGLAVDLQPARSVQRLEGYTAIVLGAPLYILRWHKDAVRFLNRHQKALSGGLPLAIFGGGPTEKNDPDDWREVENQLARELAKFPWLKPVSVEVVGGRFDASRLRFPWNLVPALKQMPATDFRDWKAIRAWAESLAARFSPAVKANDVPYGSVKL